MFLSLFVFALKEKNGYRTFCLKLSLIVNVDFIGKSSCPIQFLPGVVELGPQAGLCWPVSLGQYSSVPTAHCSHMQLCVSDCSFTQSNATLCVNGCSFTQSILSICQSIVTALCGW